MKHRLLIAAIFFFVAQFSFAQNTRLNHSNTVGWYNYVGAVKLSPKFGLHTEYLWRRSQLITNWQQGVLRVGINYSHNTRVLFRLGYAWAETFPYGEVPINGMGRDFTEHRIFEMVQLSHKEGRVDLSHRFMLEQRFVGKYSNPSLVTEDEFPLLNRVRYMFRLQTPLKGTEMKDKTPYFATFGEVFIGFGKNVNANIFDQNRFGALLGYRFNKTVRIEAGYINQILQFGRQINGQNVFQYNNGLIVNAIFNFDATKKPAPNKELPK